MNQNMGTIVKTDAGSVEGYQNRGLYDFKGIPYAAPPVGKRRWLPPEAVEPWGGVRPAQSSATIAPQPTAQGSMLDQGLEAQPQNEDCLYLNIWTPGLDDARRPVMFWIHGGGFTGGSGSAPMYKGSRLAARGSVVVVTINYRLGSLGFLNLNEVTGGKIPSTGNEGLLDQVAALEWVHNNIASFGGDPGNVTIFGESAGGMSVGCQMALPKATGLFQKAIAQSGAGHSVRPLNEAVLVSEQFLDILNVRPDDIDALRSIPVERLLAAQQELNARTQALGLLGGLTLRPVIDGDIMPSLPLDAVKEGLTGQIPIIVGTNLDEWKMFGARNPEMQKMDEGTLIQRLQRILPGVDVESLTQTYRKALTRRGVPNPPVDIMTAIQTDQIFRIPAIRLVEAHQGQGQSAYNYLFTWPSPALGGAMGAHHALELGFLFGNYGEGWGGSGPAADALSRSMQDAWLAFARNGDPSCDSIGQWPTYGQDRATMILNAECQVENAPYEEERRAWDSIKNEVLGS
ncbi:MAG: carboxylesterase/lipase family protein [Dehalococcoidales bacterium]|nr:MAG: carboxylesterase/lipase family protein [Dehalococcoidales bacterium]